MNRLTQLSKLFLLLVMLPLFLQSQKPTAFFSFNNGNPYDEISGKQAKLVNAYYSKDRFGNDNSSIYIHGSEFTYVNLGTYKALKPTQGTISLWMNLEDDSRSGRGAYVNPVILTKNENGNDFYEGYAFYYHMYSEKIGGYQATDSINQVQVFSRDPIKKNRWYHLAISYSDTLFSFYLDGVLEGTAKKNFKAGFLEGDSVMVGHSANAKNLRFILGLVDDIAIYDRVLTSDEIVELYKAPNPNKNAIIIKSVLSGVVILILLLLIIFYTRYKIRIAVKREKERSEQANKALENELRVHRALMNPHFVFNSLNGLQDFILKRDHEGANDYLIKFSQLLRKMLENNMSDSVSLEVEIDLLNRYLEIENLRFEEEIDYSINTGHGIIPSTIMIPIMMLQPFVENAIWHGLLTKEGNKNISISFEVYQQKYLKCVIDDNGIGRKKTKNKTQKKSLAIMFIKQRLDLLNRIHGLDCELNIEDKQEEKGTLVTIILPILNG